MPASSAKGAASGPLRWLGWLVAAGWWARKSPSGWMALWAACLPWLACSMLNAVTGGWALAAGTAFYAPLWLWSALCVGTHFAGRSFEWPKARAAWLALAGRARSLGLCFALCAVAALVWSQLCVSLTGLGPLLVSLREARLPSEASAMMVEAWGKEGLDGIAMPLALWEIGLGLINGFWCLLPWRSMERPEDNARAHLAYAWRAVRSAPAQFWMLGVAGVALAQVGMVFAPMAALSGLWILSTAFAYRDFGGDPGAAAQM